METAHPELLGFISDYTRASGRVDERRVAAIHICEELYLYAAERGRSASPGECSRDDWLEAYDPTSECVSEELVGESGGIQKMARGTSKRSRRNRAARVSLRPSQEILRVEDEQGEVGDQCTDEERDLQLSFDWDGSYLYESGYRSVFDDD